MKAAYFDEHGGPEVLQVGEQPDPDLVPGSVRVAVKACALNHLDLWVRKGGRAFPLPLPHIGGTDLAGVVTEVADDVADSAGVAVGDEVLVNPGLNFEADADGEQIPPARPEIIGETRWGGLAEQCVVPARNLLPKPASLSWEESAAVPLTSLTAMQMLRRVRLPGAGPASPPPAADEPAPKVLIPGGSGGVAVMAIQLAKALGAWVVTTTTTDKVAAVEALGADHVLDRKADPDWSKTAYKLTDKTGYDVVVDSVGQATWPSSLRALRPGGRLVTCGATTGPKGETDIRQLFWKQLTVYGSTMGTQADLERALGFIADGKVRPVVDSVLPLEDVRTAHETLEAGSQVGKIVLRP